MSSTLLERFVAQLNSSVFFSEFAFDSTAISVPGEGQAEIADHLVILESHALVFQLKERAPYASASAEALDSWFQNKVLKNAVRQIGDTRALLKRFSGTSLTNQRGHKVSLESDRIEHITAVVVFNAPDVPGFSPVTHRRSSTAGFVHIMPGRDYFAVCSLLATPAEVIDYFSFREDAISRLEYAPRTVGESAMLGQYFSGEHSCIPNESFARFSRGLVQDSDSWDISLLTTNLGDRIRGKQEGRPETQYYHILAELAKLTRAELRELKLRLRLALKAVADDSFHVPMRFVPSRTGCGFLILPVTSEMHRSSRRALANLTLASKHEWQLSRHVGISIRRTGEFMDIDWFFASGAPGEAPELDRMLQESYPFLGATSEAKPRYEFREP